ncbi:MAG: hypothetical protein AB7T37_16270 [Dehalococcoidia bacterium]
MGYASAVEAVEAHIEALNTHEKAAISQTIVYPFVQLLPNGKSFTYVDEDAYPTSTMGPPIRLMACREVSRGTAGELVIFEVDVDQEDDGKPHRGPRRALYAVVKTDTGWRLTWRQFLGYLS